MTTANPIDTDMEVMLALYQYLSDLRRPPQGDSRQRRIERVEALLAKLSA